MPSHTDFKYEGYKNYHLLGCELRVCDGTEDVLRQQGLVISIKKIIIFKKHRRFLEKILITNIFYISKKYLK